MSRAEREIHLNPNLFPEKKNHRRLVATGLGGTGILLTFAGAGIMLQQAVEIGNNLVNDLGTFINTGDFQSHDHIIPVAKALGGALIASFGNATIETAGRIKGRDSGHRITRINELSSQARMNRLSQQVKPNTLSGIAVVESSSNQ